MSLPSPIPIPPDPPRRLAWQPLAVALVITAICWFYNGGFVTKPIGDGEHYRNIAVGQWRLAPSPFSARFLAPLLVRSIASTGLMSVDWAFAILSAACCFLIAWCAAALTLHACHLWALPPIVMFGTVIPDWWFGSFGPEAFHAALLCGFFLLLRSGERTEQGPPALHSALAMFLLVLLICAREASALIGLILVVMHWRSRRRGTALAWLIVTVASALISSRIAQRNGTSNIHQMPPLAYMAAKVPFNTLKNLFGLAFWTNTFDQVPPATRFALPSWLRIGSIREVGLQPWDTIAIRQTLLSWFCLFGVLPSIGWYLKKRRRNAAAPEPMPRWLWVAAIYGVISFLIAPMLGAAVSRLVSYAWPVFWIVIPLELCRAIGCQKLLSPAMAVIAILHVICSWAILTGTHPSYWEWRIGAAIGRVPLFEVIAIVFGIISQVVTYCLMARIDTQTTLTRSN